MQNNIPSIKATGKGNSARIFGIVQNETRKKLKKEYIIPEIISLSISTDKRDNTFAQINKRMKVYSRIATNIGPTMGYPYVYSNIPGKNSKNIIMSKYEIRDKDITYLINLLNSKIE
jgi:hypothetical protein